MFGRYVVDLKMKWTCKYCIFDSTKKEIIIQHYQLKHGHHGRTCPLPCIYQKCVCSFRTRVALNRHLSRCHRKSSVDYVNTRVKCNLCSFLEACNVKQYFSHLGIHLKNNEAVHCPFKNCSFQTRVYSTFVAHRSRSHRSQNCEHFKAELISCEIEEVEQMIEDTDDQSEDRLPSEDLWQPVQSSPFNSSSDLAVEDLIKHRLASLFLRMESILHVSKTAIQEIVEELGSIGSNVGELAKMSVKRILNGHNCSLDSSVISAITETVLETNPLVFLSKRGPLSSMYKRTSFYKENFTVIEPVEYSLDASRKKSFVYVPILKVLTALLNRSDVLDKVLQTGQVDSWKHSEQIKTFRDGLYFKDNEFLFSEELRIALGLYIDDFEVCNPLGTSRKKHKLCAIYWVIANLPGRYRSTLSSIYLATLCKTTDVKEYGYNKILEPLLSDVQVLEQHGVFVQTLGASIRGTILYVSADNLGAHSLGGFQESFSTNKFCRFCLAGREEIQTHNVSEGRFPKRTIESHEKTLSEMQNSKVTQVVDGVKSDCVLNKLEHFSTIRGFPPDFLHDLLEGVVPVELSLCLKKLIQKKYFTFDELNAAIQSFPYRFSDKTNRPQQISKSFQMKGSFGGNGHENWTLLRLLPLIIGSKVPENDATWTLILELKDIVEILASSHFSTESLGYLVSKVSDHRKLLQEQFPDFKLRPKHHFIEHYAELIKCFGPVIDFWTIRFEAKHSFFKKVVHDSRNFKNVVLTLAQQHQLTLAYYLDMPALFKPDLEVEHVSVLSTECLDLAFKLAVKSKYANVTSISVASSACICGTRYSEGMFLSVGHTSGLPDFGKLVKVLIVMNKAAFLIEPYLGWYSEHFRCFELVRYPTCEFRVVDLDELNDYHPLSSYTILDKKLMVSPKTFLLN